MKRPFHSRFAGALALVVLVAAPSAAQEARAADPGGAPADSSARATQALRSRARANWLSDRLPLTVGDLVTVVVDERTQASESVSRQATGNRSFDANLNMALSATPKPAKALGSSFNSKSNDSGAATRRGDLVAAITVRVTEIDPGGIAHIEGQKTVNVDGRAQLVTLKGLVRSEDVDPTNHVDSERIADAVITYKGKAIAPRSGILGGILKMLWP